jgi:hypothetical protein
MAESFRQRLCEAPMYVVDDPTLALISRFVGGGERPELSDEEFFERQLATVQTYVASFPEAEREARALAWIENNARLYRQQWQKQIAVATLQATRCPDCPLANGGDPQTPCAIHERWLGLLRRYVGSQISSHDSPPAKQCSRRAGCRRPVVLNLDRRVDAAQQRALVSLAVGRVDHQRELLHRHSPGRGRGCRSSRRRAGQRSRRVVADELQRQHAHADQVGAVDPFVAARDHRPHAEQARSLGRPVARRAGAVLLAGDDDGRRPALDVGSSPPRRPSSAGRRAACSRLPGRRPVGIGRQHQVANAHIGESAAHHHLVVAAACAVGVEVGALDPLLP